MKNQNIFRKHKLITYKRKTVLDFRLYVIKKYFLYLKNPKKKKRLHINAKVIF